MAYRFNINKRYWGWYQIMWIKSYHPQRYAIGEMNKHKIDKYGINKYRHLATFRKNCQSYKIGNKLILRIWYWNIIIDKCDYVYLC